MIHTDIFLEIGSSHKICEDYIIQGTSPLPYIILSDGCSTAENSEMGSRILCHLAKQYLQYWQGNFKNIDYWKLGTWVIHNAEQTARQLGLNRASLIATLTVAYKLDDHIRIMMYGDGSIITSGVNGISIRTINYEGNRPYYLEYLIDPERHFAYNQFSPLKTIDIYYDNSSRVTEHIAYDSPTDITIPIDGNQLILPCSDGIDSFLEGTNNMKPLEFLPFMVALKNTKGKFLQRRLNKQMKAFQKGGITHFDDLSVGAFLNEE